VSFRIPLFGIALLTVHLYRLTQLNQLDQNLLLYSFSNSFRNFRTGFLAILESTLFTKSATDTRHPFTVSKRETELGSASGLEEKVFETKDHDEPPLTDILSSHSQSHLEFATN